MTDAALFILLRATLLAGLQSVGLPVAGPGAWDVVQSFPPDQQGANTAPTVYLYKVTDRRIGSPARDAAYNEITGNFDTTDLQQYEGTFQATVLLDVDPADVNAMTASDGASIVAGIIQSDTAIAALLAQDVGILRITEARNPFNVNDRNQFAGEPSVDFVLTYKRGFAAVAPVVQGIFDSIHRV